MWCRRAAKLRSLSIKTLQVGTHGRGPQLLRTVARLTQRQAQPAFNRSLSTRLEIYKQMADHWMMPRRIMRLNLTRWQLVVVVFFSLVGIAWASTKMRDLIITASTIDSTIRSRQTAPAAACSPRVTDSAPGKKLMPAVLHYRRSWLNSQHSGCVGTTNVVQATGLSTSRSLYIITSGSPQSVPPVAPNIFHNTSAGALMVTVAVDSFNLSGGDTWFLGHSASTAIQVRRPASARGDVLA